MEREVGGALQNHTMPLVVGHGAIFPMKIRRVDRRVAKRNLIVVRVI